MSLLIIRDGKIVGNVPDGEYTIEKVRKKRSQNQNQFYWGVFLPCLGECMGEIDPTLGATKDVLEGLHEYLKGKFLQNTQKKIRCPKDKRRYITIKTQISTTKLDTKDFEIYLEQIRIYFSSWGWSLPYPDDGSPKPWETDFLG